SPDGGICRGSEAASGFVHLLNPFNGTGDDEPGLVDCNGGKSIHLGIVPQNSTAGAMEQVSGADKTHGFFYRVPGMAAVSVCSISVVGPPTNETCDVAAGQHTTIQLAQLRTAVAQYGTVAWLPQSTGGRRTQYTVDLSSSSGALKNFVMASDAM